MTDLTKLTSLAKDNIVLILDQDQYMVIKNIQKTIPENEKVIAEQNAEITKLKDEVLSLQNEVKMLTEHKEEVISASEKLKEARDILRTMESEQFHYGFRHNCWSKNQPSAYEYFMHSFSNIQSIKECCDNLISKYKEYIVSEEYKAKAKDIVWLSEKKKKEADDYFSHRKEHVDMYILRKKEN